MLPEKIKIPEYFQKFPYWLYWFFNKAGGKQGFSAQNGELVWKKYQEFRLSYDELRDNWNLAKSTAKGVGFRINEGENFILIDLDDCINDDGTESEFLKDVLSKTPKNAYVQYSTRGKGIHIFGHGRIDNSWKRQKCFIADNAIEMYDSGRFFVFTGKQHPTFPFPGDILSNISDLANYLAEKVAPEKPHTNGFIPSLPPLETITVIPKSQRHASLIAYAGLTARQGLQEDEAVRYLMHNLVPKFQHDTRINNLTIDSVIKQEVREAFRYCANKATESKAKEPEKPPPYEVSRPTVGQVKTLSIQEFLVAEFSPKEHYIGPFVKQGISLVYAATGVGKTHFCIGLAFAIASGTDFLRWKSEGKAKVLYIDGELPGHYLKAMIKPLYDALTDKDIYFDIITPDTQGDGLMPNLATEEGQASIKESIDRADVIFIDNLSTLVRSGKENEAEYWAPMQAWFLGLRRRGKSVIFAHHSGKGETGSFRGTSKITDAVDLAVFLKMPSGHEAEDGCVFNVSFPKYRHYRKGDATEFEATYVSDRGVPYWTYQGSEEINSNKVLELHALGLKPKQIEIELGLSTKTIYKHLKNAGVELRKTRPSKFRKDTDDDPHF